MSVPALADDLSPAANELVVALEGLMTPFELLVSLERNGAASQTMLQLPEVDWDTYESVGYFLGRINRSCSWWIGDWLMHGKAQFADKVFQAAAITGLSEQTLLARMFVSEAIPPSRRRAAVSFSCHAAVARLKADEQTRWLKACEKGGWSYAELKQRMKAARKDERPELPLDTGGEQGEPNMELVLEVARAILRDARESDDGSTHPGFVIVPIEDIARLRAALGMEEE